MEIARYIAELIYKHDCVIIPDFGGIIANPAKASINTVTEQASPATKTLAFNRDLRNNDGLLANYVATQAGMSYADALATIKEYVREIWGKLDTINNYDIKEVGTFFLNKDNRLQFIPSRRANYLTDSYGLYPVKAKKVVAEEKEEVEERIQSKPIEVFDRPAIRQEEVSVEGGLTVTRGGKRTGVNIMVAALAVITLTFSFLLAGNTVLKDTKIGSFVDLGLLNIDSIKAEKEKEETTDVTTEVVEKEYVYYIIGGAFKSDENVNTFSQKLIDKGYDGEVAGETINGLKRVSYAKYFSEQEAEQALQNIKDTENQHAWLYKTEK